MGGTLPEGYWTTGFRVTPEDLEPIVETLRATRQARDLMSLAREIVQRRLRGGEAAEGALLTHGEAVVSQLLGALQRDRRFLQLEDRWFLVELAVPVPAEQVAAAAWALAAEEEPQPTGALLAATSAGQDDAALFGLYLTLSKRADLFAEAGSASRPLWRLAGPPPGGFVARAAAYDPESLRVLCEAGEAVGPSVTRRLWQAGLLRAVAPERGGERPPRP